MSQQPEQFSSNLSEESGHQSSSTSTPSVGEGDVKQEPVKNIPSEETPKEEETAASQGGLNFKAKKVEADKFYAANHQEFNVNETNIRQYLVGGYDMVALRAFSLDFTTQISHETEREIVEMHVSDDTLLEELYATLCEKNLLVLTGEPEMGKTTTALYLSHQLRQVSDHYNGTYLVHPLDRNVKINFQEIIEQQDDFSSRLLLFKDAFAGGNRDLLEFFKQLGKPMLGAITEKLQRNHLFLIFTADTETVKDCQRQLSNLNLEKCLPPLREELLMRGLELRLKQIADTQGWADDELEKRVPDENRKEIIKSLRTMPRICYLVEHYLLKLDDGLDLKEAISRVDNLQDWFLTDLTDNFDVWCFALTLCLCHCTPYPTVVSWFEFEFFRESISTYLRRKLRVTWAAQPGPAMPEMISEKFLLERCRAEIYKDPASGVDAVRFINEQYPEMLWEILLSSNRKTLSLLVPHLTELAQLRNPRIRARAAGMLGRIGEIDPIEVTFSLMDEWTYSGSFIQMATVGYLYQGIWASRNSRYREDCLKRLNNLATEEKEEDRPDVWTAIAAYKQLGVYDQPLAMEKFKEIAKRKFTGPMENTQRLERILHRIEKALEDRSLNENEIDKMALTHVHDLLREIALRVFSQESAILLAIQYAIVVLCLTGDPIQVFDELRKWTLADKKSLGALVALIFLEYNGIATALESKSVEMQVVDADGSTRTYYCNLLVSSISSSEDTVRRTARFLEAVYDSFTNFFPIHSCSYFKKSFVFHLKNWIDNALPVERLRTAMAHLFDELLMTSNQSLSDLLSGLLNYDPDFLYEESKYYLFKRDVRRRRLELDSISFSLD